MKINKLILILTCVSFSCVPIKDVSTHSLQEYSSPFSPTTNLRFNLDTESDVLVLLYNTDGELLDTLVNEVLKKGENIIHSDVFSYTSGIYFCKYIDSDTTYIRKISLIK